MQLASKIRAAISAFRGSIEVSNRYLSIRSLYLNPLLGFRHADHEKELGQALLRCLTLKSGAFIDVGANIGQTFLKLVAIDDSREYAGFEPQLSGCFVIDDLISRNNYKNKVILPIALSDGTRVVKLGVNCENDQTASIAEDYRPDGYYGGFKSIVTMTGDEALAGLGIRDVAAIKIDVEGAELEVIRGFRRTLEECRPFVIFEVLSNFLSKTRETLDEHTAAARARRHAAIEAELSAREYVIFRIADVGLERCAVQADPRRKYDYLAAPVETATALNAGNS